MGNFLYSIGIRCRSALVSSTLLAVVATGGLLLPTRNDAPPDCEIELDIVPAPVISQTSTVEMIVPTCPESDIYEIVLVIPKYFEPQSVSPEFKDLISGGGSWDRDVNYIRFEGTKEGAGAQYSAKFIPRRESIHSTGYDGISVYIHSAEPDMQLRDGNNESIWVRVGNEELKGDVLYSIHDVPGIFGEDVGLTERGWLIRLSGLLVLTLLGGILLVRLNRGDSRTYAK